MATQPLPATDSAAELHELIGDDVTATFESDPTFVDSNPTGSASSDNLEEQRPGAGKEFQAEDLSAAPSSKGAGPDPDEEDEFADDEDDEDEDDLDDEDDIEDVEDDDDDELDDEEDDDEDDFEDEDDDEDDEDEDDEDEVKASSSSASTADSSMLRADGLLGYEDEADDAANKVDRVTGDVQRERAEARKLSYDPDENPDDSYAEVNPEAEREEQDDSNITIRPVKPVMDFGAMSGVSYGPSRAAV